MLARTTLTTCAALICLSNVAMAQTDDERKAAADKLYTKGVEAVISKNYPRAIIHFQNGYNIDPDPKFLYNVSVCYGRLKDYQKGITFAQRVIGADRSTPKLLAKATSRMRSFQTILAAQGTAVAIKDKPAVIKPIDTKPKDGNFGTVGWIGVAGAGVGAALLGTAMFYSAGLGDDIQQYEDDVRSDPNPTRDQKRFDELESRQGTGQMLLYSGAGLTALGVGLIVYELASGGEAQPNTTTTKARLNVAPIATPQAQGGVMTLTFGF